MRMMCYMRMKKGGHMENDERLYTASDIAEWFFNYVRFLNYDEDEEYLTNLKLQKLLYYAQGCCLGLYERPLFNDKIEHWKHGPVVPNVYWQYAHYHGNPIQFDKDFTLQLDSETEGLLKTIYDVFGRYSAWGLRNMTRSETPWLETEINEEITPSSIKKYFMEHYIEETQDEPQSSREL